MSVRNIFCALALMWGASAVEAECRQALALGLDVSGSVDQIEYRLQLDGLAQALVDAEVQAAFLQVPERPVRLLIYEWSGLYDQRVVLGWTTVTRSDQLSDIAAQLRNTRQAKAKDATTAISAAMLFGAAQLAQQSDCWQKTLDISGDGPANIGAHPDDLTDAQLGDVTINGLVIGPQSRSNTSKNLQNVKSLEGYYRSFVLHGPAAFAEVAQDHSDFAAAMRRKLVRELQLPSLSRLGQLRSYP